MESWSRANGYTDNLIMGNAYVAGWRAAKTYYEDYDEYEIWLERRVKKYEKILKSGLHPEEYKAKRNVYFGYKTALIVYKQKKYHVSKIKCE
jgi:hypothetical protein